MPRMQLALLAVVLASGAFALPSPYDIVPESGDPAFREIRPQATWGSFTCKNKRPDCRSLAKDAATCASGFIDSALIHDECCEACSHFAWGSEKKTWTDEELGESHNPPADSDASKQVCTKFDLPGGKFIGKAEG